MRVVRAEEYESKWSFTPTTRGTAYQLVEVRQTKHRLNLQDTDISRQTMEVSCFLAFSTESRSGCRRRLHHTKSMHYILFSLFSSILDPNSNAAEDFSTSRSWRFRHWWTVLVIFYGWIPSNRETSLLVRVPLLYHLLSTNAYTF